MSNSIPEDDPRRMIVGNLNGERITFLKFSHETNGEYTRMRIVCKQGGGPPPHYHASYTERFTALKEPFTVFHNGIKKQVSPGDSLLIPINEIHSFTNESSQPVEFECEIRPGQTGFEQGLAIAFGLQNDGLAKADGSFSNPVHAAIFFRLSDIYIPGFGGAVITGLMGGLAMVAGWVGWEQQLIDKYCSWME